MKQDMAQNLEQKLAASWPPRDWQDVGVVVAVSGGADSVALLRALAALKTSGSGRLVAAHFNHQLRGEDSEADQRLVAELCRQLPLDCEIGRASADLRLGHGGDGLEEAARQARYDFLQATAERIGARYVVTAHTADDQAETILHRIVRGTGLGGLAGIPRARPLGASVSLLRPMLDVRRAEVIDYLAAIGQPFRDDATNAELKFTRNRLRHELLPKLAAEYNPAVVDSLVRLGKLAGEVQQVVDRLTSALYERAVTHSSAGAAVLDCRTVAGEPINLVRELFVELWRQLRWPQQDMGFVEWQALAEMAVAPAAESLKRMFPGQIVAERRGDQLTLSVGP
jgi:tRNA(Ile)-lysidine synthase